MKVKAKVKKERGEKVMRSTCLLYIHLPEKISRHPPMLLFYAKVRWGFFNYWLFINLKRTMYVDDMIFFR